MSKRQWIILAALLFVVALANYRNIRLVERIATARAATGLSVGITLQSMALTLSDGEEYSEDFRSEGWKLVFILSPSCRFCEETLPLWRILTEELAGAGDARVLAINVSPGQDAKQYREALRGIVVGDARAEQARANRMTSTPQTILVSSKGEVTHVWRGALSRVQVGAVLEVLEGR